jgi:acetylornithine/succinyldiaminopimelate/putrescine aminotransferase
MDWPVLRAVLASVLMANYACCARDRWVVTCTNTVLRRSLLPCFGLLLQNLQKAAFKHKMLLIPSGARESIRFLPPLNISAQDIDIALEKFEACCKEVFG